MEFFRLTTSVIMSILRFFKDESSLANCFVLRLSDLCFPAEVAVTANEGGVVGASSVLKVCLLSFSRIFLTVRVNFFWSIILIYFN